MHMFTYTQNYTKFYSDISNFEKTKFDTMV